MTRDKKTILKERAEQLAKKITQPAVSQDVLNLVIFLLAGERYALESIFIKEVYPLKDISYIPGVPAFVRGLINIRRRIISVIDLRFLFDLAVRQEAGFAKVIILQKAEMEFGVLAEEIVGLGQIFASDLQESLPSLNSIQLEFLKGITPDRLLVLDGEKLLSSPSIKVNQVADV